MKRISSKHQVNYLKRLFWKAPSLLKTGCMYLFIFLLAVDSLDIYQLLVLNWLCLLHEAILFDHLVLVWQQWGGKPAGAGRGGRNRSRRRCWHSLLASRALFPQCKHLRLSHPSTQLGIWCDTIPPTADENIPWLFLPSDGGSLFTHEQQLQGFFLFCPLLSAV